MRILHIIRRLDPADGGPPEMVRQLAESYRVIGDTLEVVSLDDPTAPYLAECSFPVYALGPGWSGYGVSRRLLRWLHANIGRFDFLVINGVWQFPSIAGWLAARRARVPYTVFTHGGLDVFFKRRYPLKHVKKLAYWPLQYRVLRDAGAVLFTSAMESRLARESFRPNEWTSIVLPYGTNPPPASPAEQAAQRTAFEDLVPALRGRRFLLFLSRIHEKKGCDLLIDAFAHVAALDPGLALVIAGPDDGGLAGRLQKQAESSGVSGRIFWPGMLRGPAKYGAFRSAEAFVLPSHQENFGIVVAEALACGTPVLLSNQVNIWPEILESGVGLVEPDTQEGTNRLLERWIALSAPERGAMATRAEAVFRQRFSLRRCAESMHVLAILLAGRTAARQPAPPESGIVA